MALYCGIDLGTTNCTVSLINMVRKNQDPLPHLTTLPINQYDKVFNILTTKQEMPSYLYFKLDDPQNQVVYTGDYAKQEYIKGDSPMNVVNAVKTRIGGESVVQIKMRNKVETFSMTECSAIYLKNIILSIKKQLGDEIIDQLKEVIITIPAAFNHAERIATENAAKIAGFKKVILLAEPTAALYWYIHDSSSNFKKKIETKNKRNVLVYDIGGGTLDVTLATITRYIPDDDDDDDSDSNDISIDVIAKSQRMDLGGNNFDQRLAAYMLYQFETGNMSISSKPLIEQQQIISRMVGKAEEIKLDLNSKILRFIDNEARLKRVFNSVEFLVSDDLHYSDEIRKEHLDQVFKCFVLPQKFSLLEPIKYCLEDAKINKQDIDDVILTGGMSNFYLVKDTLKDFFPNTVSFETTDTATAVSKGAALYHYSLNERHYQILKPDLKEKMSDDIWIKYHSTYDLIISKNLEKKSGTFDYIVKQDFCATIPIFLYYGSAKDDPISYTPIGGDFIRLKRAYNKNDVIKINWEITANQEIKISSEAGEISISEKNKILTEAEAQKNKIHTLKINDKLFLS